MTDRHPAVPDATPAGRGPDVEAGSAAVQAVQTGLAPGLEALERRLAWELAALQLPVPRWTPPCVIDGHPLADVAIIGGGMSGLALQAAMLHRGLDVVVYDAAPEGFEGPWATTARMETLRSPKQLAGPALGLPSLTFRAWYEAGFGRDAWEALDKIPRLQWMDYLRWYRRVLGLQVHNRHTVTEVRPEAGGRVRLHIEGPDGTPMVRHARRLVLATGRAGLGGASVPDWARRLPRERWWHSSDEGGYEALHGLRVAVVGAGASAMDSAATALECGAARVHLLVRRPDIPRINKGKGIGNPGHVQGHERLPDAWKWRVRHYIHSQQVPPPRNSTLRVSQHANAFFHLGCAVRDVQLQPQGTLRIETGRGPLVVDHLIVATGFAVDWAQRPMLRHVAPHVRVWADRWTPEPGQEDAELSAAPDLGRDFEFQPRPGHDCPGLDRIHCFTYPAALSLGVITGDIPAISDGALRLANALAGRLWAEDIEVHHARLQAYAEPEVLGDEWVDSPLPPDDDDTLSGDAR